MIDDSGPDLVEVMQHEDHVPPLVPGLAMRTFCSRDVFGERCRTGERPDAAAR